MPAVRTNTKPSASSWQASEDAVVLRLRERGVSWEEIASALSTPRTAKAVKNRHYRLVISAAINTQAPPSDAETKLLRKAIDDVKKMTDKWWFVAARYNELRSKRKPDTEGVREGDKKVVKKMWDDVTGVSE